MKNPGKRTGRRQRLAAVSDLPARRVGNSPVELAHFMALRATCEVPQALLLDPTRIFANRFE
jgi:hypothetical protein